MQARLKALSMVSLSVRLPASRGGVGAVEEQVGRLPPVAQPDLARGVDRLLPLALDVDLQLADEPDRDEDDARHAALGLRQIQFDCVLFRACVAHPLEGVRAKAADLVHPKADVQSQFEREA